MADIKIADMEQWTGAIPGVALVPFVFANQNYVAAMSQITPFTVSGATGSFTTRDGKTVTVVNGLITAIDAGFSGDSFIELEG